MFESKNPKISQHLNKFKTPLAFACTSWTFAKRDTMLLRPSWSHSDLKIVFDSSEPFVSIGAAVGDPFRPRKLLSKHYPGHSGVLQLRMATLFEKTFRKLFREYFLRIFFENIFQENFPRQLETEALKETRSFVYLVSCNFQNGNRNGVKEIQSSPMRFCSTLLSYSLYTTIFPSLASFEQSRVWIPDTHGYCPVFRPLRMVVD